MSRKRRGARAFQPPYYPFDCSNLSEDGQLLDGSSRKAVARTRLNSALGGQKTMWNLEDHSLYFRLFDITIPHAFTWGDGNQAKREDIRAEVAPRFPATIPRARWWAFRLCAKKGGRASFDVENIPKLIVDAFSGKMLRQGGSQYPRLELYGEDTVDRVGMVQVAGEAFEGGDSTRGEVLGRRFG